MANFNIKLIKVMQIERVKSPERFQLGKVRQIYVLPEILKFTAYYEDMARFLFYCSPQTRKYLSMNYGYLQRALHLKHRSLKELIHGIKELTDSDSAKKTLDGSKTWVNANDRYLISEKDEGEWLSVRTWSDMSEVFQIKNPIFGFLKSAQVMKERLVLAFSTGLLEVSLISGQVLSKKFLNRMSSCSLVIDHKTLLVGSS